MQSLSLSCTLFSVDSPILIYLGEKHVILKYYSWIIPRKIKSNSFSLDITLLITAFGELSCFDEIFKMFSSGSRAYASKVRGDSGL